MKSCITAIGTFVIKKTDGFHDYQKGVETDKYLYQVILVTVIESMYHNDVYCVGQKKLGGSFLSFLYPPENNDNSQAEIHKLVFIKKCYDKHGKIKKHHHTWICVLKNGNIIWFSRYLYSFVITRFQVAFHNISLS